MLPSNQTFYPPNAANAQPEAHVKQQQHQDASQPMSKTIDIILAAARMKEEKNNAKKLANRKSAYSSRERKKAKIRQVRRLDSTLSRHIIC
jgi:hypothetical protein